MGHSVGAYILLEIVRNHRKRIQSPDEDFDLIGGILLFPTIADIAQSPSGVVVSQQQRILRIPHFAQIAGACVKPLAVLVPMTVLYYLVKLFTWFPDHAARTTAAFIKSRTGVKQSLHLAKDEMDTITDDHWGEEVWGAATAPGTTSGDTIHSNLIFYWGQNDKWVAAKTRNNLIEARGFLKTPHGSSEPWKPTMFIDDIPHGFCISSRMQDAENCVRPEHSEVVAEKVWDGKDGSWVEKQQVGDVTRRRIPPQYFRRGRSWMSQWGGGIVPCKETGPLRVPREEWRCDSCDGWAAGPKESQSRQSIDLEGVGSMQMDQSHWHPLTRRLPCGAPAQPLSKWSRGQSGANWGSRVEWKRLRFACPALRAKSSFQHIAIKSQLFNPIPIPIPIPPVHPNLLPPSLLNNTTRQPTMVYRGHKTRPTIDITLTDGQKDAFIPSYTSLDEIKGQVAITTPVDTKFEHIFITFEGVAKTYVEKIATSSPTNGRTEAFQCFLRLVQPMDDTGVIASRVAEAGKTYTFPFNFVVPERLLPQACDHARENDSVQEAHVQLPPSLGDPLTAGMGKALMDDMTPDMALVSYAVKVRMTNGRGSTGKHTLVAETFKKVRVVPAVDEKPPLSVQAGVEDDYRLRKEKDIRKGMFKGKMGRLVMESLQPHSLRLPSIKTSSPCPATTMATVNLRFDPASPSAQPPRLGTLSTKLKVATFFASIPMREIPARSSTFHYSSTKGIYVETLPLSSRCVASAQWEKHSPSTPSTSTRRDS
ncbi:MAG: hypothetical protein Q9214_005143, partial [Letrouitia sp. 1 TL-2023]